MSAIRMADWVAGDNDQYVEIALRSTPDPLRTIRHELPDLIDRRCSPAAHESRRSGLPDNVEKYRGGLPG
jgi:hypothetical protein